jgi:predicted Rossmann fold nucleotide-binding protein DprA/Smf involved in DNA uptake
MNDEPYYLFTKEKLFQLMETAKTQLGSRAYNERGIDIYEEILHALIDDDFRHSLMF